MTTDRRRLSIEVVLVLAITFGMSGVRATLKLIDAALAPAPLNEQRTVLNDAASSLSWLDAALQLASAATLLAWGGLALFLLGTFYAARAGGTGSGVPGWPPSSASPGWCCTWSRSSSV